MNGREKFHWNVQLQGDDGQVSTFPVSSYWSPDKEGTPEAIALAAKGMAFWQTGGKTKFMPINVERV